MRPLLLALFFLAAAAPTHAQISPQDITGVWTGNYYGGLNIFPPRKLVVEIRITDDSVVSGTSHLVHRGGQYEHYTIEGVWRAADSSIFFAEDSTIGLNLFVASNCTGDYDMLLDYPNDTTVRLDGRWRENDNAGRGCFSSRVYLEKPRPARAAAPKPLPASFSRTPDVQALIELSPTEMDSLRIDLADDAEVDGDIVSLYLNNTPLAEGLRLAGQPQTVWATVPRGAGLSTLRLVAESEGAISPCTARVVVTTATGAAHELRLSSSRSSNAVLELFEKEER